MNKINDSTRRGTMLVPLSTVHKCIVIREYYDSRDEGT